MDTLQELLQVVYACVNTDMTTLLLRRKLRSPFVVEFHAKVSRGKCIPRVRCANAYTYTALFDAELLYNPRTNCALYISAGSNGEHILSIQDFIDSMFNSYLNFFSIYAIEYYTFRASATIICIAVQILFSVSTILISTLYRFYNNLGVNRGIMANRKRCPTTVIFLTNC